MTAATRTPDDRLLPPAAIPTQEIAVWGMALFCATEAALFAYLLTSYFYLGVTNPRWPPAGIEDPKLTLPLIMTGLLLASSGAAWWGERGIKQGRAAQLRLGLGLAMLLEFRDTSIRTEDEVVRVLALPVLALVPLVATRHDIRRRRRRIVQFAIAIAVVAGLTGVIAVWKLGILG